jgi:hypothetical protein
VYDCFYSFWPSLEAGYLIWNANAKSIFLEVVVRMQSQLKAWASKCIYDFCQDGKGAFVHPIIYCFYVQIFKAGRMILEVGKLMLSLCQRLSASNARSDGALESAVLTSPYI